MRASTRLTRAGAILAVGACGLAVASCGSAGSAATAATSPATSAATPRASATPPATPSIDRYVAAAKQVYDTETGGQPTLNLFHQVVNDPKLLALLRAGNDRAALAYATTQYRNVWAPEHMALLRITRGGKQVLRLGVPWVVYPMPSRTVTRPGHPPVTIQIAEQDVIGFVRSMHNKHPAVQVVTRDASMQHAVSLLGPAAKAPLPASGTTTIRGVNYAVRSFPRSSWTTHEVPVTVWILQPTG